MDRQMLVDRFINARRKIIENRFSHLNPMQRQAVLKIDGPLLILAGAGSGKTTVLINRIINILTFGNGHSSSSVDEWVGERELQILEDYIHGGFDGDNQKAHSLCCVGSIKPYEIIAITFTNKAANELKERLLKNVNFGASEIWAQTFHAACVRILRRNIDRLGYDKSFTIYDQDDKKKVLLEIIKNNNLDDKIYDAKSVSSVISRAKDNLMTVASYKKSVEGDGFKTKIAMIFEQYEKTMKDYNALDFDDIISKTVTLLKENIDVLEYYQDKFRYVLVDEYQDTNHAQYILTELLAGKHKNICVVGDDDQSIYKFRGATIENILNFEKNYDNASIIRLEQNYRSSQNILDAANEIIKNNLNRKGKNLWTDNNKGCKIKLHMSQSYDLEASYIAESILQECADGKELSDIAILYRSHAIANAIEMALRRNGITYKVFGNAKFFDRIEVKDVLAYLYVIQNDNDILRFKRIINVPSRKIGDKTINAIVEIAMQNDTAALDVCLNVAKYPQLKRASGAIYEFAVMINELKEKVKTLSLDEFYDEVIRKTGYVHALLEKPDKSTKTRIENIDELKSNIVQYMQRTPEHPTLEGFLEEVSLYTDLDNETSSSNVTMMTIHSAKGLEFPVVFICAMEDGIFPGEQSKFRDEEIEEERRLCYVAVTRAKEKLYLTFSAQRTLYGQTKNYRPSMFIKEIPDDIFESNISKSRLCQDGSSCLDDDYRRASLSSKDIQSKSSLSSHVKSSDKLDKDYPVLVINDVVNHKAFGEGTVIKVVPMGSDSMLIIDFKAHGQKKLLAKNAMQFIEKMS